MVVLTFSYAAEILTGTIKLKAIQQQFPVVLFIMLKKVVLTFGPKDEIRDQRSGTVRNSQF